MGSLDMDEGFSSLFTRLPSIDTDVFGEIRHEGGSMMSSTSHLINDSGRCQPHRRPLLSSVASLPESAFRPSQQALDNLLSPDPRCHSDPGHLEDILSSLHLNRNAENQHDHHHSFFLTRSGTIQQHPGSRISEVPDRRTFSTGDVSAYASASLHQPALVGDEHRRLSDAALAGWDVGMTADASQQPAPQRYKTELCRPFEEHGTCRYGTKCQFAHGRAELRNVSRHPKYKTEMCRTFHTTGYCPYGPRCHFRHNDETVKSSDQRPTSLLLQQQQPPLSRHMSMPGAAAEHAAVVQRDNDRRRAQLVRLLQSSQRTSIDETPYETEMPSSSVDWSSKTDFIIDCRRSVPVTGQSCGWLSSSSSASSPISFSSIHDHVIPSYATVEPPPGLNLPAAGTDVRLAVGSCRSPARSMGGISPTFDERSPAVTPVMFNQLVASGAQQVGHSSPVGRSPMFPVSFYTTTEAPVSTSVQQHYPQVQRPMLDSDSSQYGAPEVAAWLSGTVGDRRAAFAAASTAADASTTLVRSFDETSSGCSSFSDDDEEADLRRKVASLTPDQLATLLDLVKSYAPKSSAARPISNVTSVSGSRLMRSVSVNEPSTFASHHLDHMQWLHQQVMNAAPIYPASVAPSRSAGVCG